MRKLLNLIYNPELPQTSHLDLFIPEASKPRSFLLHFHGGGLEEGERGFDAETLNTLIGQGIAVATASYRLYPEAKFPDFITDAAAATAYIKTFIQHHYPDSLFLVGGTSAGAYLSMMLYFDQRYLARYQIKPEDIAGWMFDGGQPTVHYNVLRERGLDTRLIRVDEAAPLYYVDQRAKFARQSKLLFILAEQDLPGRFEQTQLLLKTMAIQQFDMSRVRLRIMPHTQHSGYPIYKAALALSRWVAE
ncbi:MAG: alpha/beta hydrolase fold domain-containing protein [Oscillospiraceae bacterium]|nr:alpha/beta hydrolase fold domain-containing protein [Oscillospiraceae bacterium]MDD4369074.1 alpha/beta hydrolase fold domain-containing protein [Oscillospiraceae bacterium]